MSPHVLKRPSAVRNGWQAALSSLVLLACGDDPVTAGPAPVTGPGPGPGPDAGAASAPADAGVGLPGPGAPIMSHDAAIATPGRPSNPPPAGPGTGAPIANDLDRTVTFEWPETQPGDGTRCQGGTYVGMWTCTSLGLFEFSGAVTLHFVESMDGEFLDLVDAELNGMADEAQTPLGSFKAGLAGRLDCTTLKFSAEATMGVYGSYNPLFSTFEAAGTFTGALTGTLDPDTAQIEGDWSLLADLLIDCVGPWTASLAP
jgi:hypothetical protein